jgi:hypothetical protein
MTTSIIGWIGGAVKEGRYKTLGRVQDLWAGTRPVGRYKTYPYGRQDEKG